MSNDNKIIEFIVKTFKYFREDPITGLSIARSAVEHMVKTIAEENGFNAKMMKLDAIIKTLKLNKVIPVSIILELNHIRIGGNEAIHAGGGTNESIGDISPCAASLKKTVEWYYTAYKKASVPDILKNTGVLKWEPRMATLEDIEEWGWTPEEIVRNLIELDYYTMVDLSEMHVGTDDQWIPIYRMYPDLWTIFVDRPKSIAGYWHYLTFSLENFDIACRSKLHDNMITLDTIVFPAIQGEYEIYFSCISLLKKYRDVRHFKLLFESFIQKIAELAEDGIFISRICANAFIKEGISLCRSIGMEYECEHEDKGLVFFLALRKLLKLQILKHYPGLLEKYKEHFNLL